MWSINFAIKKIPLNAAFKDVYQQYCLMNICLPVAFLYFGGEQQNMYATNLKGHICWPKPIKIYCSNAFLSF